VTTPDEVDDTAPDPSASPVAPAPLPPGDFANDPFFQSPSTWLAIVAGISPILTILFTDRAPAIIESLSGLAPLVAFVALIIQRNKNHRNVQQLNASLAHQRLEQMPPVVESTVLPAMDFAGAEIDQLKAQVADLTGMIQNQVIPAMTTRKRGSGPAGSAERIR
jgi:hypothetical protein